MQVVGQTYDAIDLFAGAGGWDIAAQQMGLRVLGIELDVDACATRYAAGLPTLQEDVSAVTTIPATGLIASPPCQTFSIAGRGAGRIAMADLLTAVVELGAGQRLLLTGDLRTGLVLQPLRWALDAANVGKPYRWITLEQVATVLPIWEAMAVVLRGKGYSVWTGNLQAEMFGVPQTRRRAVLAARLDGVDPVPVPTHSRYYGYTPQKLDLGMPKWISMAEALGAGWADKPAKTVCGARGPRWAYPQGQGSYGTGQTLAGLVSWAVDRPSTTVQGDSRIAAPGHRCMTTDCHVDRDPESMFVDSVRVSVQEAALLQTFPVDFPWQGTKTAQYHQIGNAIPPVLAASVLAVTANSVQGAAA